MKLLLLLALCLPAWAGDVAWKVSLVTLDGASAADAASSWGRAEMNPVLGPRFGPRGAAIKAGIFAGTAIAQVRTPRHRKAWTVVNFIAAGAIGAVTIRNVRTR